MFYPTLFNHFNLFDALDTAMPKLEAYDEDDGLVIRLDLPGYDKGNISVTAERGVLTISASTEEREEPKGRRYLVRSGGRRSFSQTLVVPQGYDESKTDASYEAGVLTVKMPRTSASKTKRIDVK
jgi:HSP20 family protein